MRWELVGCHVLSWTLIFVCLCKGIKSAGKVNHTMTLWRYDVMTFKCFPHWPCVRENLSYSTSNSGVGMISYYLPEQDVKQTVNMHLIWCTMALVRRHSNGNNYPVPLFAKQMDVLPQHLVKSRSREIQIQTFLIALKFGRHRKLC